MSRPIKKASTNQSIVIFIMDSTAGTPETGVTDSSAGLDLWYRREGSTLSAIVVTTLSAISDAHADGGIGHIAQGLYRLDLPDAAFASGADGVVVGGSVTGMIVVGPYIPLFDVDPYDSTRAGMTALPAAAADAAGGLPISDAGGLDLDTLYSTIENIYTDTGSLQADWADGGRLDVILDGIYEDTGSLQADWVDGGRLDTILDAIYEDTGSLQADWVDGGRLDTILDAIYTDTGSLQADWTDGGRLDLLLDEANSTLDGIIADTAEIGAGGSLLDSIPWNSAWDTEAQSEAADAITAALGSIADAVWDEPYADHRGSTSFGLWIAKGIAKGQAWSNHTFAMVDSTDNVTPKTGLTITTYVSKDAAAFGAIAGTVAEISNGIYQLDATAADMNADTLIFRFTATGASDSFVVVQTS